MSQQKLIDIAGAQYVPTVVITDPTGTPITPATQVVAPSTGTTTSTPSAIVDTVILAANIARKGAIIYNESTSVLYLLLATGASSTTNYSLQVPSNGNFTLNPGEYTGTIKGVWSAANGFARATEFV